MAYDNHEVMSMQIHEAAVRTGLTKKAITYYCEQGLLSPSTLENGYREFSRQDIDKLNAISVLRKLGVAVNEIQPVLSDSTGEALQRLSVRMEIKLQREQAKKELLRKLRAGASYKELQKALEAIENNAEVAQRLLQAFPSFYGRFFCLHFARFLQQPAVTERQQAAYRQIIEFLDNAPELQFPIELQDYLQNIMQDFSEEQIHDMIANTQELLKQPDKYIRDHHDAIERYRSFKQSGAYRRSPVFQIQKLMKDFMASSGYYENFIPAMKELSPSYAAYAKQLEAANAAFVTQYPDSASQD
jgi:DNA-binding transcriptional MerR regulator